MKITKMICDKKDKNKVHIFLDNQPYTILDAETVFVLHLKLNMEIDVDLLDKINNEKNRVECFSKALSLISKSLKTKKQLKDYLYQKGYKSNEIDLCIDKLENIKLIDDESYCKKYIEQEKNKKGKMAIQKSLFQKGISKEIIENNFSNFESQNEVIKKIIEKYMKTKTWDLKNKQKLIRYLLGKGFSYEEINYCVGNKDESWD